MINPSGYSRQKYKYMKLFCFLFGHKWDTTDKYRQPCKRRNCMTTKYMTVDRHNNKISFVIFDVDNFK